MKANMIMELATEVIYLEKETNEHTEGSIEWRCFLERKKEARHIMVKLFGSSITTKAIIEVRENYKENTAFEVWKALSME